MRLFKVMETAFSSFDNTVKTYLAKAFNSVGLNASHSQVFNLIFDGIKGILQNVMFYIEDAFTEQNIFTASRKNSVYSLAKLSGYEPYYGSAASGTVLATIVRGAILPSAATKVFIPNNSTIINLETNIKYILSLSTNEYVIDVTKPLVTHEFKIIEGSWRTSSFTGKGKNFETYSISTSFVLFDKAYVDVYVNGVKYSQAASLYDMAEGEESCVISVGYDGNFEVMFGDDTYGKKIQQGDSIVVEWIAHNGNDGNILASDQYNFSFYSSGRDTYGNVVDLNKYVKLEMSNTVAGGTNADSIEVIKSMVGYNSRSMILATDENFTLFFKRFSFIGRVNCWSHESTMKVIAVCTSNKIEDVKNVQEYFALNIKDLYITNDQKDQIASAMMNSNRTFAGISLDFKDPSFVQYAAVCIIKLKDNFGKEAVKEEIKNLLGNYFINLPEGVQTIYKSDIITYVINNCNDIESFDIQFISEKAEKTFKDGYYTKTTIEYNNGMLLPKYEKVFYSSTKTPGIDDFGNIVLDSKLEIPLLHGGFSYYNKDNIDKNSSIKIETLQYVFI